MVWSDCFIMSVGLFLLTCLIVIFLANLPNIKIKLSLYESFFIGVIISLFVLLLPIANNNAQLGITGRLLYAVAYTMMIVTGGRSVEILNDVSGLQAWQYGYAAFLAIMAFVMTIGFILQFFTGFFANFQCLMNRSNKLYIFSELNKKSVILAKSTIESELEKILIVFTDSPGNNTDNDYINEVRDMRAVLLKKDITCFPFYKRQAETIILFCKENEVDNISDSVVLFNGDYENGDLFSFYVFSSEDEYENIMSSCVKQKKEEIKNKEKKSNPEKDIIDSDTGDLGKKEREIPDIRKQEKKRKVNFLNLVGSIETYISGIKKQEGERNFSDNEDGNVTENKKEIIIPRVILIDSIHTELYRLFVNRPLYLGTKENDTIQLLVIGSGQVAKEAVQIASWFGQMISRELSILMLCHNPENMKQEFLHNYPEISMNCGIHFVFDVEKTFDYVQYANENGKKTTYIIIALENDLSSLKRAMQLRTIFSAAGLKNGYGGPEICVWNEEEKLHDELRHLKNEFGGECQITPFGGNEMRYSFQNIFNGEIDQAGLIIHQFYGGNKNDYFDSEYNRKSSCALALHLQYTVFEIEELFNGGKKLTVGAYDRIKVEHEIELLRAEHERWCAFIRARGYQELSLSLFRSLLDEKIKMIGNNSEEYSDKYSIDSHIIETAKLHACLVKWDPMIGNPLSERKCSFDHTTEEAIILMQSEKDDFDDLDMLTLTCWEYLKKNPDIFKEDGKKQKKNFKSLDRDVLEIMPLIISKMKMIYIRKAAKNSKDVFRIDDESCILPFLKESIMVKKDSFVIDSLEGKEICQKKDWISFEKDDQYRYGWHCRIAGNSNTRLDQIVDENIIKALIVKAELVTREEPSLFDVSERFEFNEEANAWISKSREGISAKIGESYWLYKGLINDVPDVEILLISEVSFKDYFVCDRNGMILNTLEKYHNSQR